MFSRSGRNGSDNRLREVQRNLHSAFSNLHVMSTLGIEPPGGCHYPAEGYAAIARLIGPLIDRDFYGVKPTESITPPNLLRATWVGLGNDAIELKFDQPVTWAEDPSAQMFLDGRKGEVVSASTQGALVRLKLSAPASAKTLTYVNGDSWTQKSLIRGANGIAALSFCEVPIEAP
jgi:hypothetical protein